MDRSTMTIADVPGLVEGAHQGNLGTVKGRILGGGLFVFVCFVCLFVCLFVCSFVRLFVCSFVRLFVCSFVRSFVCSFVCFALRLANWFETLPISSFFGGHRLWLIQEA